jgi:hypothetical protein
MRTADWWRVLTDLTWEGDNIHIIRQIYSMGGIAWEGKRYTYDGGDLHVSKRKEIQ